MTKIVVLVNAAPNGKQYDFSAARSLVEDFKKAGIDVEVYTSLATKDGEFCNAVVHALPADANSFPKRLNALLENEKKERGKARYLHVVADSVKLVKDPTSFLALHEKMMSSLKLSSWLNTTCDPVNYIYAKYNPRVQIDFGEEGLKLFGSESLLFTSNANTHWMCFDLDAPIEDLKFNEQFTIPMYFIIEFLARRRARASEYSLDFMNMYPTITAEQGVFEALPSKDGKPSDDVFKNENEKFKALNLDISPTNVVDKVLERLYNTFKGQQ